jgi:hypothetical protein
MTLVWVSVRERKQSTDGEMRVSTLCRRGRTLSVRERGQSDCEMTRQLGETLNDRRRS